LLLLLLLLLLLTTVDNDETEEKFCKSNLEPSITFWVVVRWVVCVKLFSP
jgi:hypothetical protein